MRALQVGGCLLAVFAVFPVQAAEDLPAFKAHMVTGDAAGKEAEAGKSEQPLVLLFIAADKWERPIARYLKKFDEQLTAGIDGAKDASAVAVWLTDDPAKYKEYLPKAQQSLNFSRTTLAVFEGQIAGPTGWNVDVASALTAIVVKNGREIQRFQYQSTNDTDVPELIAAVKKAGAK